MSGPIFHSFENISPLACYNRNDNQRIFETEILNDEGNKIYVRNRLLGQGAYGKVYEAKNINTNEMVVIKQMIEARADDAGLSATMLREASLLLHLKHKNIVQMKDIFFTHDRQFCLVFELCQMDLYKYLEQQTRANQPIQTELIKKWSYQMINAISYMHSRRILHRDLKPQNVLVTQSMDVKIGDLGLSREHSTPIKQLTPEIVTLWYRAPELLLGTEMYCGKVDIWSLALIIIELAKGQPLFVAECEWVLLMEIFKFHGTPNISDSNSLRKLKYFNGKFPQFKGKRFESEMGSLSNDRLACDLLKKMLNLEPQKRLNAIRLVNHAWFDMVEKDKNEISNSDWTEYCASNNVNMSDEYMSKTLKTHKCKCENLFDIIGNDTPQISNCNEYKNGNSGFMRNAFADITHKQQNGFANNINDQWFGSRRMLPKTPNISDTEEDIDIECHKKGVNNGSLIKPKLVQMNCMAFINNKQTKNKNSKKRNRKEYEEFDDVENMAPAKKSRM